MKKSLIRTLILGCFTAALFSIAAQAQSTLTRQNDWSGLYIGGQLGAGQAENALTIIDAPNLGIAGAAFGQKQQDLIAGGQIGYNMQFGSFVIGPEVSVQASNFLRSSIDPNGAGGTNDEWQTSIPLLVQATARAGIAVDDWLFYVKGGYAGADIKFRGTDPTPITGASKEWHNGWIAGAGIEYMLSPNVTFGLEYNYMDFGEKRYSAIDTNGDPMIHDIDSQVHAIMVRFNLKLGGVISGL